MDSKSLLKGQKQYQFPVKMTDSMKFGPEWLRNLSSEGTTGSSSVARNAQYTLADHRYGREEMLALFEQSQKIRPPASISNFKSLFVDQALNPLALAPATDDENQQRMWARPALVGAPRGRGGSMDRGRGRGRGNTFHPGFTRSTSSYDEPVRPWGERNGEVAEWGGERSPRKDFAGGRGSQDNWRRHRADEADPDGWRTANHRAPEIKWGPPITRTTTCSWRDFADPRGDEHSQLTDRQANSRIPRHSGGDAQPRNAQRRMFDEDHLPEWATENPSETGGTFDASGAFHGSDDEYPGEKGSQHRPHTNNCGTNALQKSASQHNILPAKKPSPLSTSQSATNLIKKLDETSSREKKDLGSNDTKAKIEEISSKMKKGTTISNTSTSSSTVTNQQHKSVDKSREHSSAAKTEVPTKKLTQNAGSKVDNHHLHTNRKVDDELDHMKEVTDDIVAKLILDDELPKGEGPPQHRGAPGGVPQHSLPYPAGLSKVMGAPPTAPPMVPSQVSGLSHVSQDKWYYRDPQGETQGPFSSQEMADWFGAGYFTVQLMVRRQCDDQYFTLGDLVKQCPGAVPFLSCRLPPLKNEPVTSPLVTQGPPDPIQMQLQMQRMLQRHADYVRTMTEPWSGPPPPQTHPDMSYLPAPLQSGPPLLHMLGQMQQTGKLPTNSHQPMELDSLHQLIQQMGEMTPSAIGGPPPSSAPSVPPPGEVTNIPIPKEDPIQSLLRQLAANQPQQQQRDYWEMHGAPAQFTRGPPPMNASPQQPQWLGGNNTQPVPPHAMWDLHTPRTQSIMMPMNHQQIPMPPSSNKQQQMSETTENSTDKEEQKKKAELEKEQKLQQKERKEASEREKKKKEQEQLEKAKAVEEKRKEELRKLESEKKVQAEKQRKDEERVRKEIEKTKREAEEKRLRELEERRRLKEQRKAEEEARKKAEEDRKREEEEDRLKKEVEKREEQSRRQADALRKMQEQQLRTKVAPWCQSAAASPVSTGISLTEIQKAEREKRTAETALLVQQQKAQAAAKEAQELQTSAEKATSMQLKWATKKPTAPKKIKSLAEIQAEEQERIAKQTAEARLLQQKEKDVAAAVAYCQTSIWSSASQTLSWNTNNYSSGFWDEAPVGVAPQKPPQINNNSSSTGNNNKPSVAPNKINKSRAKKEEQTVMKIFDKNSASSDEFTAWCMKTLASLTSDVDIPTFVGFLRDIESPYEVKDYVRQYLGDSAPCLHFANQFVEKRSRVKEMQRLALQHKDDLCQPAPAINPSTEFQEVKGKSKKAKKSKMTKVDARILGFSVTAAENRINVGDRDYGDI